MGRFAAVMKSVLRALGSTGRFVWERCERTNAFILRMICAPVDVLLGGTAPGHMLMPFSPEESFEDNVLDDRATNSERLKLVAGKLLAGDITDKDVRGVPERLLRWLTLMNDRELSRIIGATHNEIEGHVYGHKKILGVLEFTKRAVDTRAVELAKREEQEAVERRERKAQLAESERLQRQFDEQRARSRREDEEFEIEHGHPRIGYGI